MLLRRWVDSLYDSNAEDKTNRENVTAAVAACVPAIYYNDAHVRGVDRELELWGGHGITGEVRVIHEVERAPEVIAIPKCRYPGFFQTDLDLMLRELGAKTVIAAGADTNICVLHTLADAYFNNYASIVVTDATKTFLCGTQEGALEHFEKCYGFVLCTTEESVTSLGA